MDATEGSSLCFTYGWGSIRDGVLLFQYSFLTGVLLTFSWGGVVIKSGAQIEPIRYILVTDFSVRRGVVMFVFTFSTQKMLSEPKIENIPFVSNIRRRR